MAKKEKKSKPVRAAKIPKHILSKIPYLRCFEEQGIFETERGIFTKCYYIQPADSENLKNYNNSVVEKTFARLLNELPSNATLQFIIHNRLISQEDFLNKTLIEEDKEPDVNKWIKKYNEAITENADIGHNNMRKNKYFIISIKADSPEDANIQFSLINEKIINLFNNIYGINAMPLTTIGRMKILYSIFNPKGRDARKTDGFMTAEGFKLSDLKKNKLTTKDCIAPLSIDTSNKNHLVLNGDTFTRTFFIVSVPTQISNNLISDITNISSNMVFSAIYEPVDAKFGFDAATKAVADNTIIHQSAKRDSIKDRREKVQIKTETMINETEDAYFNRSALNTFKESVALNEKAMLCSFFITLYADDLETLDRDTKLLHISTSKFACQVRSLDLQQLQGFQSVLPLAKPHCHVKRLFPIRKLAGIPPLDLQSVLQKDGLFNGLNAINDNLVLLNRKNNPNQAGIIAGTEHSGKTFQMKREIFNAAISSKDKVMIIANGGEYDEFVKELGGVIVEDYKTNPFSMIQHYGMHNPDKYSKTLMVEALVEYITRPKDKAEALKIDENKGADNYDRYDAITREVEELFAKIQQNNLTMSNFTEIMTIVKNDPDKYKFFNQGFSKIVEFASRQTKKTENGSDAKSRIQLVKCKNTADKVVMMDYLWNRSINDKQKNVSSWIFIDSVDDLLVSEQTSNFLLDYVEKMNAIKNVLTMVLQSSVKLFTDSQTSFRTEDLINAVGYYKLLNQGAIERKRFTELLNISHSLSNYITSTELGKGIILTSSSNTAFDDNFYGLDEIKDNLYSLFKIG